MRWEHGRNEGQVQYRVNEAGVYREYAENGGNEGKVHSKQNGSIEEVRGRMEENGW
jgi:hypothetical protein